MSSNGQNEARKIHDRLKHPIIDADGHWAEFAPHMREEFRRIGGEAAGGAPGPAPARPSQPPPPSLGRRRRPPGRPGGVLVLPPPENPGPAAPPSAPPPLPRPR